MTDEKKNEILKAFVFGYSIQAISKIEGMSEDDILALIADNEDTVKELKTWYGYTD